MIIHPSFLLLSILNEGIKRQCIDLIRIVGFEDTETREKTIGIPIKLVAFQHRVNLMDDFRFSFACRLWVSNLIKFPTVIIQLGTKATDK